MSDKQMLVAALNAWLALERKGELPIGIDVAQCVNQTKAALAAVSPVERATAWDDRDAWVRALKDARALRSPAELVEAVAIPTDLAAALTTGRSTMMKITKPRAMNEEEVSNLYRFIAVLIDTNFALQAHARQVAQAAEAVEQQIVGVRRYSLRLHAFANFNTTDEGGE